MKKSKRDFYSANNVKGDDEIIVGAFDTETFGLGGELASIQYGIFGKVHYATGPEMVNEFLDFILEYPSPVIWYCHFAQYDWRYFMGEFVERGLDINCHMRSDSAMYQITIKNAAGKKVILRDSYAIWNSKLSDLADAFCPEIPKLEIDIENFDPKNPQHIEYAKRDVLILLVGLPRLFSAMKELYDVNPNGTFASTAMKAWERSLGDKIYPATKWGPREAFIRQAYYGGLTFLTSTRKHEDCETFDVNSSYPSVMRQYGVPSGRCVETKEFIKDKMGIYRVRVKAPENLIVPILPARNSKGAMRWFSGEFETCVTNRELIFAANNGYEILEIFEGIYWEDIAFPFSEFVGKCEQLRKEYGSKPRGILAKYFQNSLYGKYCSRRERLRIIAAHSAEPDELIGAEPYGDDGAWYLKKEFDDEMRVKPEWGVFITAHARLKLLQAVYSIGAENVIYGDTDSITVKRGYSQFIDVGLEYGQWKLEKQWKVFRAIAPKVYSGILDNGQFKGAAKGLPKKGVKEAELRELLEDGKTRASVLSLDSLRVTLKKGVRPATTLTRESSNLENSINFVELTNGDVRPRIAA